MSTAYDRPFHPIALDDGQLRKFAVGTMLDQLRGESSMQTTGRASLTLVHDPGLTLVLTAAAAGTHFDQHEAAGPTFLLVLEGRMTVSAAAGPGATARLGAGEALAIGPDVRHVIEADADGAFLTIIGEQVSPRG